MVRPCKGRMSNSLKRWSMEGSPGYIDKCVCVWGETQTARQLHPCKNKMKKHHIVHDRDLRTGAEKVRSIARQSRQSWVSWVGRKAKRKQPPPKKKKPNKPCTACSCLKRRIFNNKNVREQQHYRKLESEIRAKIGQNFSKLWEPWINPKCLSRVGWQ